ncbi:hypothetical protein VFPPC_15533 [Pochonia chlamydosporia 170]|uniref:Uncharacterized protein n=1 Tax=Pochonia chlamydosporia 170 TaxID=1380566 RepID=A0A179FYB5_METCM|nr:hypothetical protein VFPPC_15533 [Pochonia chlamydosporia 170]OAQ70101.1 hypothetical protein VFPPC_15533 [Pochonia chlamydosporia 170]
MSFYAGLDLSFLFLGNDGANVYLAGDKVVERGIIRQREGRNGLVWSGLVLSYDGNAFPMEQLFAPSLFLFGLEIVTPDKTVFGDFT